MPSSYTLNSIIMGFIVLVLVAATPICTPAYSAFKTPSKPIGLFYSKKDADFLKKTHDWILKEDAGRGYRRLVPSPTPLEIVEKEVFHKFLDLGFIAIGAGGGGIPVIRRENGDLDGVEAVIDKDKASALLANEIGIDTLILLTEVDFAYLNFNTPQQKPIAHASVDKMEKFLQEGHFLEGSMKPKVESAINFLKAGGKRAIIARGLICSKDRGEVGGALRPRRTVPVFLPCSKIGLANS